MSYGGSFIMESFRKAYGTLKDSTMVGLASVNNGQFKDLDIAIVKATNHVESPPKERHVRKILTSVMVSCPQANIGYCIYALSRRLAKTRSWIVAVKTLIVFHRILREGDPSFREQLMHISGRANVFQISNFKDDSSSLGWDCSGWIRAYALFLEERIECLRKLHFNIEADRMAKSGRGSSNKVQCKIDMSNTQQLLEHLPTLQQLLHRLLCCQPNGFACRNFLIQYAFALVAKESFKVCCAINDGIVNLVDMYFGMPKTEAVTALDIYKRAVRQADQLAEFYSICKTTDFTRCFRFPTLKQPPPSFLATMEEYVKEAPSENMENENMEEEPQELEEPEEEVKEVETERTTVDPQEEQEDTAKEEPESESKEVKPELIPEEDPVDLLGLRELSPEAKQIEESNALALAIIPSGNDPLSTNNALTDSGKVTGWELALVSQPSNMNKPQAVQPKMGGGFDKLLLDSLYEDEASRQQLHMHNTGYTADYTYYTAPQNPFAITAPPSTNTMAMVPYQQQIYMQNQAQNMVMMTVPYSNPNPYAAQYQYPQQQQMRSTNPFEDPFGYYPTHNGNHAMI